VQQLLLLQHAFTQCGVIVLCLQVAWEESATPLQDVTAGVGGLDVVRAWREEVSC
jgi:hypothetical protein